MDKKMSTNLDEQEAVELSAVLFVDALAHLLKEDEGICIHHDDTAFIISHNAETSQIQVMQDDDYLLINHGTLVWMHYEGSSAPEPEEGELDLRPIQDGNTTRH